MAAVMWAWLTFEPVRGRQDDPVCASNRSAEKSRMNSKGVATLQQRDALGDVAFELDALDLRAILFALAGALRLLVAVEFALDTFAGSVEEIGDRPEQIFEIRFQPRVAEHLDQGVEDRGQRRLDNRLFRKRARIGLVLKRPVGIELHLINEAIGRGGSVVRFEAVVGGQGKVHGGLHPFAAAPLAA